MVCADNVFHLEVCPYFKTVTINVAGFFIPPHAGDQLRTFIDTV